MNWQGSVNSKSTRFSSCVTFFNLALVFLKNFRTNNFRETSDFELSSVMWVKRSTRLKVRWHVVDSLPRNALTFKDLYLFILGLRFSKQIWEGILCIWNSQIPRPVYVYLNNFFWYITQAWNSLSRKKDRPFLGCEDKYAEHVIIRVLVSYAPYLNQFTSKKPQISQSGQGR